MNRFSKIIDLLRGAQEINRTEKELAKELEIYTEQNQHFASLNYLRDIAYETSKNSGFHQENEEIVLGNFLMNQVSEAAELWEAYRNNSLDKPCDKSEKMEKICGQSLTCLEEEMADQCIRLFDLAKTLNVDLAKACYVKNMYNKTRSFRHGGKLA